MPTSWNKAWSTAFCFQMQAVICKQGASIFQRLLLGRVQGLSVTELAGQTGRIPWTIAGSLWVLVQQLGLGFMVFTLASLELESKVEAMCKASAMGEKWKHIE